MAPVALAGLGARVAATTVILSVGGETRVAGVSGLLFDTPWIRNDVIKGGNVGEDGVGEEKAPGDGGMSTTTTRNAVARPARPPSFGMKEEERAPPVPSDAQTERVLCGRRHGGNHLPRVVHGVKRLRG